MNRKPDTFGKGDAKVVINYGKRCAICKQEFEDQRTLLGCGCGSKTPATGGVPEGKFVAFLRETMAKREFMVITPTGELYVGTADQMMAVIFPHTKYGSVGKPSFVATAAELAKET